MSKSLMSIQDTAEKLGVRVNTLYDWIHQRKIPYVKVGRLVKFDLSDIDEWLDKRRVQEREF